MLSPPCPYICHHAPTLDRGPVVTYLSSAGQRGPSQDISSLSMVAINTQYVSADGLNIFYRSAGSDDAPVLILLHGFPCVFS